MRGEVVSTIFSMDSDENWLGPVTMLPELMRIGSETPNEYASTSTHDFGCVSGSPHVENVVVTPGTQIIMSGDVVVAGLKYRGARAFGELDEG
jgi:hypothetical protein